MPEVTLSAGTIEYEDTGGSDPVIVLLHGVLMDSWQWRDVVPLPTASASASAGWCLSRARPQATTRRGSPVATSRSLGVSRAVSRWLCGHYAFARGDEHH